MNEIAVSRLRHILLSNRQGKILADQLTWTVEEFQSTSVELQDVSVHQFKYFPHMSVPLEEFAVSQQLRKVLAYLLIRIE